MWTETKYVCDPDVLYHHGIKGQKWGVRTKDGTLTAKGRKQIEKKIKKHGSASKAATVEMMKGKKKAVRTKNAVRTIGALTGIGLEAAAFQGLVTTGATAINPMLGVAVSAISVYAGAKAKRYVEKCTTQNAYDILEYQKK